MLGTYRCRATKRESISQNFECITFSMLAIPYNFVVLLIQMFCVIEKVLIVPCSGTSVAADKFKRVGDKEKVLWKHRNTRRKCGLGMCANWDVLL